MKIQNIPIVSIKPYENNPRKKKSVDKIAQSINDYGFLQPIIVDTDMVIVAGHGRYEAAKMLEMAKVPTIIVGNGTDYPLAEEQIKAYRIADNKLNEYSDWDFTLLNKELELLAKNEFDITSIGFENQELESIINFTGSEEVFGRDDAFQEWNDMPEFDHEDQSVHRTIKLHFMTEEDVQKFSRLLKQPITEKTKFMYYPEQERKVLKDKEYALVDKE